MYLDSKRAAKAAYAREWRKRPENLARLNERKRVESAVYRAANPEKCRESIRASKKKARTGEKRGHVLEKSRGYNLKASYGITVAQYDAMMVTQGGVCAICSSKCKTGRRLAVDHSHATGAIRGLLCALCNRAIGCMGESSSRLEAAIAYLNHGRN